MADISNDILKKWKDFIPAQGGYDPAWVAKIEKMPAGKRAAVLKRLAKKYTPDITWKTACLYLTFLHNGENIPHILSARDYNQNSQKKMRELFYDFQMADQDCVNGWFSAHVLFNKPLTTEGLKPYIDMGANSCFHLDTLLDRKRFDDVTLLHRLKLFTPSDLAVGIQWAERRNNTVAVNFATRLLPEHMQPAEKPAQSPRLAAGWHKIDPHTISRVSHLPGGLVCQDIFNFYAEDLRSIVENPAVRSITQTIREFNTLAGSRLLKTAAEELSRRGGNANPHPESVKKPAPLKLS